MEIIKRPSREDNLRAANALFSRLQNLTQGERITWAMLSEIAGGDVQKEYKYAWLLARNRLMYEQKLVFDSIRGIGYAIADNNKLISKASSVIESIHKTAGKGINTLDCIEGHGGYMSLNQLEKESFCLFKTELNFIKIMTSQDRLNDMRPAVNKINDVLTASKVIEFLAKS